MNAATLARVANAAPQDGAGLLVMRKALGVMRQDGQDMVELLKKSAPPASPPHLGRKIDISA